MNSSSAFDPLTKRSLEILRKAIETDEELVADGINCYLGEERISWRTIKALLRCLAISDVSDENGGMLRYVANSSGKAIARRPELAGELAEAVFQGRNVTVVDDHLQEI